jgi:hypothetical protein
LSSNHDIFEREVSPDKSTLSRIQNEDIFQHVLEERVNLKPKDRKPLKVDSVKKSQMQTSSPHSKKMEDDGFSSGNLSGSDIEPGVNRRIP